VEAVVFPSGSTETRIASPPPVDATPIVTGSMIASVLMKACHCASESRVCWSEETDLDIALGSDAHESSIPSEDMFCRECQAVSLRICA